jgi:hypothetical protein
MAPMVDRTAIRFPSQVGSAGTRKGVGGRERPGETTENRSSIRARWIAATLLGSRAQSPLFVPPQWRGGAGGRLAQLVRALP